MNFEISNKVKATAFAILLFAVVLFAIPSTKDDLEKPKLINIDTKQETYQQKLNESFIVAMFMCILVPFLILHFLDDTGKVAKRRSLLEIYKDIPMDEKIKFNMPDVESKAFNEILYKPADETHSILRYASPMSGLFYNINVDCMDDWKTRNTISPVYAIWMSVAGVDRSSSQIGKKSDTFGKFIQTAKGFGASEQEIRRIYLEKELNKEEARKEGADE